MNPSLLKSSFYCGIITSTATFFFTEVSSLRVLSISSILLPGFVYGSILCDIAKNELDLRRFSFIALSGGLYIFDLWIATSFSIEEMSLINFCLGSVIGSTLLFCLYYYLIDQNLFFLKGLILMFVIGVVSAIIPFIGNIVEDLFKKPNYSESWISAACIMSMFVVWQTLFGWIIIISRKSS